MTAKEAYEYALKIKAPFPEGEALIATDAAYSYCYARDVLQAPFPLGEKVIVKDKNLHQRYIKLFPKPAFFKY